LIHQFGTIEEIFKPENLKTLPPRMQNLLLEGAEEAVMSKRLATLDLKAPIKLNLKKCVVDGLNLDKVVKLFEELEFKSLVSRIPGFNNVARSATKNHSASKTESSTNSLASLEAHQQMSNYTVDSPHFLAGSNFATSNNTTSLDLAVTPVLEKMSKTGVLIDLQFLNSLGLDLKAKLIKLEKDIYSKIGHQFNLNSPKQLQVILFDELKLPVFRKTKTGRSTDEETLRELTQAHPVIPLLLGYRQLFKLVSTYIDALPKSVGGDQRIHSTFNVEGSATGRLSSQDPNLQNIPIKDQAGGEIRKAFVAPKGCLLLAADYSQIELRIMAHFSEDPALKQAFEKGLDIHSATAAKIFKLPVEKVTKQERMVGKTMNFATLYGQGPHALSRQLKVPFEIAQQYILEYFAQFPKIRQWMEKTLEFGYEKGYVETLWGRKRYIPELKADNRMIKAAGERAAINHPVQGTAADMIKKAMVEIDSSLRGGSKARRGNLPSSEDSSLIVQNDKISCQMILQVHDELLFECSVKSVKEVAKMVKDKMENALKLSVPVVVDLKVGPNWGEMKLLSP